jgi:phenylalanyl-tRNA synthetase alpha chain
MDAESAWSGTEAWFAAVQKGNKRPRMAVLKDLLGKALSAGGILEQDRLSTEERSVMDTVAKKRGSSDALFRASDREVVLYRLDEACAEVKAALSDLGISGEEFGKLTAGHAGKGTWRRDFRPTTSAFPPRVLIARRNPYAASGIGEGHARVPGLRGVRPILGGNRVWNSDSTSCRIPLARDSTYVYTSRNPPRQGHRAALFGR